jgi:hypothetical protein
MPQAFIALAAVVGAIVVIGGGVVSYMKATQPIPAQHAATVEACNGAVEIAALEAADAATTTKIAQAQNASGTIAGPTGTSPLPVVARVANNQYVVTVGSGADAKTCSIPIATRSL